MFKVRLTLMIKSINLQVLAMLQREIEMPFVPQEGLYIKVGEDMSLPVKWVEWDILGDWVNVWLETQTFEDETKVKEMAEHLRSTGWF